MNTLPKYAWLLLANFLFFACTSQSGSDLKKITEKEKAIKEHRQDVKLAAELDNDYKKFIQKYPSDTNVPHMIFEDAQISIFPLKQNDAALSQLEILYTKYPTYRHAPDALFKSAYLNEKEHRYDKAKAQYLLFVKTYPTHELASQAKELAEMTGLSEEEQFRHIMAKKNAIDDSVKNQKKVAK